MNKQPYVYILASNRNGTLYVGVTSDLIKRVYQHRNGLVAGFTKRYHVHNLVWIGLKLMSVWKAPFYVKRSLSVGVALLN